MRLDNQDPFELALLWFLSGIGVGFLLTVLGVFINWCLGI